MSVELWEAQIVQRKFKKPEIDINEFLHNTKLELRNMTTVVSGNTQQIEKVYKSFFDLIQTSISTFGDGFQITDLLLVPTIWSNIDNIVTLYKEAYEEVVDLDLMELEYLTQDLIEEALTVLWQNNGINETQTESLNKILLKLSDLLKSVKAQFVDGLQWEDIAVFGVIASTVLMILQEAPRAVIELKNLSAQAIAELTTSIVVLIASLFGMKSVG